MGAERKSPISNIPFKLDKESFLNDVIQVEAKKMLAELNREKLHVILINAPYQNHIGQKIRVADNKNPLWYQKLYSSYPSLKRNHTLKSLDRIIKNNANMCSIYDRMLLQLIINNLGEF